MTHDISTLRDKTTGRRGCYQSTRYDGLLRVKEFGTGRFFYIKPQHAVLELRERTLANKRKAMSMTYDGTANRHRRSISVVDTREYAGPVRGGTRHKLSTQSTQSKILFDARRYKAEKSGKKYVDGLLASDFA